MMLPLELYVLDYMEERRTSFFVRGLLHLISKGFACFVHMRNWMFDCGLIEQFKAALPVVSVGNIIAGGAGKTALVEKLGRDLSRQKKVCVLLRGYRSKMEKKGGGILPTESFSPNLAPFGDEACLLKKHLPHLLFFVGKNRCLHAKKAASHAVDLIVLDDGMQYRRLHRDLELAVLHAEDLYGKGHFLPRGTLRDSPKRLARADYIFINHVKDQSHFDSLRKKVKKRFSVPIIGVRMLAQTIRDREGKVWDFSANRVRGAIFCGLGKPQSFVQTVAETGLEIIEKRILPDHSSLDAKQLTIWAQRARDRGCQILVCSEKDWVKLPPFDSLCLPIARLEAKMEVVFNAPIYQELLDKILQIKCTATSRRGLK